MQQSAKKRRNRKSEELPCKNRSFHISPQIRFRIVYSWFKKLCILWINAVENTIRMCCNKKVFWRPWWISHVCVVWSIPTVGAVTLCHRSAQKTRWKKRGACLWHFGEPWPCIVDNCFVDFREQVKPAYYVHVSALTLECDADQSVFFSNGYCMLLPNESIEISLDYWGDKQPTLFISGFGVPYRRL